MEEFLLLVLQSTCKAFSIRCELCFALVPCDNWTASHRNSETSLTFPAFQNIYLSMHCELAVLIQSSVIFSPGCLTPVVIP
jgi:hypothetical protein